MKITANRLTLLRILLLPLPCALLYGGPTAKLTAIGLTSLLGITDYFDGHLARRQGVTRLGVLLDPIADKIFITVLYLFLVHLHYVPLWLVILLLVREFLITSLRAITPNNLPVSWLAKLKTSVQMVVAILIVLTEVVPPWHLVFLCLAAFFLSLGSWFTRFSLRQKIIVAALSIVFPLLGILFKESLSFALGLVALIFTWYSAFSYLQSAWPFLWKPSGLVCLCGDLLVPVSALIVMPRIDEFWLIVPLILIVELIRQALELLSPKGSSLGLAVFLSFSILFTFVFLNKTFLVAVLGVVLAINLALTIYLGWKLRFYFCPNPNDRYVGT